MNESEIYIWLKSNEQALIDILSPQAKNIIDTIELFKDADVDLSGYIDELFITIKEGIEEAMQHEFNLNPEETLIAKQDTRIKQFIIDLQKIVINGGSNEQKNTLH